MNINIIFYNYLIDLAYRIICVIGCFVIIYYNIDIILNSIILSYINTYLINSLDSYDYTISLNHTNIDNDANAFYNIANNSIITTYNAQINYIYKSIVTIIYIFPYIYYHYIIYDLVKHSNTNILCIKYLTNAVIYLIGIYAYNNIIVPIIFAIDWDYLFDSDIANYIPYGSELLFFMEANTLHSIYIIGITIYILVMLICYYTNNIYIRTILYVISFMLMDINSVYVIFLGEWLNIYKKLNTKIYLSTSPKTIS